MEVWTVCLLGVSHARCGSKTESLRSHKARAVLASLLLPARVPGPSNATPTACSRQTLADRFWCDNPKPRLQLRQALTLLRGLFGDEYFECDQSAIRATPGAFVTNIDRLRDAYRRANAAPPEERLHLLIEAEGEIGGLFLEGCERLGDDGEAWLASRRAEAHAWIAEILLALADAFERTGNLNGAIAAARRAVEFQPEGERAQGYVWRLSERTGQEVTTTFLEPAATFERAAKQIAARKTAHLTGKETRLFHALYKAKFDALPPHAQKAFSRLAVFPAPFSPDLALQVARVSRRTLLALSRTALLERSGETFFLTEVVRECAWRQVPSATRTQLNERLVSLCENWMMDAVTDADKPPSFLTVAHAEPFLKTALQWILTQPSTIEQVDFILRLRPLGLTGLTFEAIPYLDNTYAATTNPMFLRFFAAFAAACFLFDQSHFSGAVQRGEQCLSLGPLEPEQAPLEGMLRFLLGNACHYAGNSYAALAYLREAEARFQQRERPEDVISCVRVRAEILNHLGDYEEALNACNQAVIARRALDPRSVLVADALFWKGSTLLRLNRSAEASPCIEEALSIWQDTGDDTGVGFCLRLLGRMHADQGRYAEARAHLTHAALLHKNQNDEGSRRAAVEVQADIFVREGRTEQARILYEECLASHEAQGSKKAVERLQEKLQNSLEPTATC